MKFDATGGPRVPRPLLNRIVSIATQKGVLAPLVRERSASARIDPWRE
jgi:hypothetical protein